MKSSHDAQVVKTPPVSRLKILVRGVVQGVGFRPFVYRLASELRLTGWVRNSAQGVHIEVEGNRCELDQLLRRLQAEQPPRSCIQSLEPSWLDPVGYPFFKIRESDLTGEKQTLVNPDIAICHDCRREIFDPANRRFRYPFTNCTHCGPRFTIIERLPYDRAHTSMKQFTMCPQCQAEYDDPRDRRFHAQPNACPKCGPHLELWDDHGGEFFADSSLGKNAGQLAETSEQATSPQHSRAALLAAAAAIRQGRIVAVKGLGGFHLVVSAQDENAVRRLRERKHREEKPFALMFPSLDQVKAQCHMNALEERLLCSPEAPIVLLRRKESARLGTDYSATGMCQGLKPGRNEPGIAPAIAPGNPCLGVMLPSTPLHHLLMAELGFPVVATSGNVSDEPICIDNCEALERLSGVADLFLVHNRPILRRVDDSVVRVMLDRELMLRRARGYAPLPFLLHSAPDSEPQNSKNNGTALGEPGFPFVLNQPALWPAEMPPLPTVLAVGGHLKNSVGLSVGPQVFISQHIGDLGTESAFSAFRGVIQDFQQLYEAAPQLLASDAHPDYVSTKFAPEFGLPVASVQHHLAHVLACMAENELRPPVLGVGWDGTGHGLDGTIWGGEFLLVTDSGWQRAAHLRPFRVPGGDSAIREPRRSALGLLFEIFGESLFEKDLATLRAFSAAELTVLKTMLARGVHAPFTSSAGRLFDAVASLAGVRQRARFEGQAAMELEFALRDLEMDRSYSVPMAPLAPPPRSGAGEFTAPDSPRSRLTLDWAPMAHEILADLTRGISIAEISIKFHNALVHAIVAVAEEIGEEKVALSGGCFQNRYLTEQTVRCLRQAGFRPYWHQRVPPNDGGIALGQVMAVLQHLKQKGRTCAWQSQEKSKPSLAMTC